MMSGHGANPIFFNKKKIKIERPEHSLPPTPLRPISHFCLNPPPLPPPKIGRYMCITPYIKNEIKLAFLLNSKNHWNDT